MDLSTARDELRARGFDGLSDDRANHFLNAGKNALEDIAPWPWLEDTASGALPLTIADLKAVLHVYNTTSRESLEGADRRYLRDTFGPDLTTAGTPTYWYLDGLTTLRGYPGTTASVTVDYIHHSPELSTGTDTPEIPARLHTVWVDLGVVEAYMDTDEPAMAQTLQAKVDVRVQQALGVYFGRNLQNPEYQTLLYASEDW